MPPYFIFFLICIALFRNRTGVPSMGIFAEPELHRRRKEFRSCFYPPQLIYQSGGCAMKRIRGSGLALFRGLFFDLLADLVYFHLQIPSKNNSAADGPILIVQSCLSASSCVRYLCPNFSFILHQCSHGIR